MRQRRFLVRLRRLKRAAMRDGWALFDSLREKAARLSAFGGAAALDQSGLQARDSAKWRSGLGIVAILLAVLALLAPLSLDEVHGRIGFLLVLASLLEIAHGFRRSTLQGQRAAWFGGGVTLAMGLLLLAAPYFAVAALLIFLAGSFGIDAVRYLVVAVRSARHGRPFLVQVFACLANLLAFALLLALRGQTLAWTVAIAGAIRILGTAWNIFLSPVFTASDAGQTAVGDLGLPEREELRTLADRLAEEETARGPIDRGWIAAFIATLFAIHIGRMGFDRTFLGILSPGVAVLGDLVVAILVAFALIIPGSVLWRKLTRGLERRVWDWCLEAAEGRPEWARRALRAVLTRRLRFSIRLRQARYSFRSALSRGLQIGLPWAAIMAATVPVFGMSWYFDTENWAIGVWNSWAEERADTWREAMVRAVVARQPDDPARAFAVAPPGVPERGDFAFLVIGDTGEGDASQHVLRSQFLDVVQRDDVKFVIISSDVVYPTGAMRDYEAKFWLPFMGTRKPVYAIPGNHDWYDALEGFNATFLEPAAARAAMQARVEVDRHLTSTTRARIDDLIAQASRLRQEYGVPTQLQQAPYFQLQTETFALLAVDTGAAMRVDALQWDWLRAALESARGKTKMVILGHPFYAGGHDLTAGRPDFAALHQLLQEHEVAIVMAGDTHDLEYYAEPQVAAPLHDAEASLGEARPREPSPGIVHHFVNGGGGAYLSFGTSLAWPQRPVTAAWAYYPAKAQVVAKIDATTPLWKRPAWWWTTRLNGWPFSTEWLSAAFDVNVAPFYQSFMEVRVEPSRSRIRLIPYGIHGRLRWSDFDASPSAVPSEGPEALVEWVVPMRK
jgi:uncharacterized membrane protein HdeD (DUF308 family)/3',5'-cyclic AMP phosphodiesterase CpdA